MKKIISILLLAVVVASAASSATIPKKAKAVTGFQTESYMGAWYEIARLDTVYEKNLIHTKMNYTKNNDGTIIVLNTGYNTAKKEWVEADGIMRFVKERDTAMLEVSFFGPFYTGYNVIAIDQDYRYALVAGKNLKFLWLLSRNPDMPESVKSEYLQLAAQIGYKVEDLLWLDHSAPKPAP